jgi:hypothetical protein
MLNRTEVIQRIVGAVRAQTYLEIGVAHGETLLRVNAPERIGIDPARPSPNIVNTATTALSSALNAPGARFVLDLGVDGSTTYLNVNNINQLNPSRSQSLKYFQMPSDDFFANEARSVLGAGGIDVAFVDGLHEWRQAVRDVENCLRYLNHGGVIVMHDCSPTTEIIATPLSELEGAKRRPGWDGAWTGDVYRAVLWLRSQRDDLDVRVLDCDWGVGLVRRMPGQNRLNLDEPRIGRFSFAEFAARRRELLNLCPPEHIEEYTASLRPIDDPLTRDFPDQLAAHRAMAGSMSLT